jgi:hypothetical protein
MLASAMMDTGDRKCSVQYEEDLMQVSHDQSLGGDVYDVSSSLLPKIAPQTSHPIQRPSGCARDNRHAKQS